MISQNEIVDLIEFAQVNNIDFMRKQLDMGLIFGDNNSVYAGLGGHSKDQTHESFKFPMRTRDGKLYHKHPFNTEYHLASIHHTTRAPVVYPTWFETMNIPQGQHRKKYKWAGFMQPLPPLLFGVELIGIDAISENVHKDTKAGAPHPFLAKIEPDNITYDRTVLEFSIATTEPHMPTL